MAGEGFPTEPIVSEVIPIVSGNYKECSIIYSQSPCELMKVIEGSNAQINT